MSTQRYRLLAQVDIQHTYFQDGRARALHFSADRPTQTLLQRFAILPRSDEHSLSLLIAEAQLDGLWSERHDERRDETPAMQPRQLGFWFGSRDPQAAYYTDFAAQGLPCTFSVDDNATAADGSVRELTATGSTPLTARPSAAAGIAVLYGKLLLPLNPSRSDDAAAWRNTLGCCYRASLPARHTVWKYLLLGDWHEHRLRLVDPQNQTQFSTASSEALPDGRQAWVIRSLSAIRLQERPMQRFQLRDAASTPEKILIQKLPAAAPRNLHREVSESGATVVSEIFVNR